MNDLPSVRHSGKAKKEIRGKCEILQPGEVPEWKKKKIEEEKKNKK